MSATLNSMLSIWRSFPLVPMMFPLRMMTGHDKRRPARFQPSDRCRRIASFGASLQHLHRVLEAFAHAIEGDRQFRNLVLAWLDVGLEVLVAQTDRLRHS